MNDSNQHGKYCIFAVRCLPVVILTALLAQAPLFGAAPASPRERTSLNAGWRFTKGDLADTGGRLKYQDIKDWILPFGSEFTTNADLTSKSRPAGNPAGVDPVCTQVDFDDSSWRRLNLPHDWGIEGPFDQALPGETGKLPWPGVAWYRKLLDIPASDQGRRIYLDVDGAMAYATVWLNGKFIGGWPYGYASWQVELTPYLKFGGKNVLTIRLDNPPSSSRWYPGGGIYRNVWLEKTSAVHVGHWGTYVTTPEISSKAASVALKITVNNDEASDAKISVATEIFELDANGAKHSGAVAKIAPVNVTVSAGKSVEATANAVIKNPKLWSSKTPNRYVAVTTLTKAGQVVDTYETPFGVRTIKFTVDQGFLLNGERLRLNGVCDHHDLGALGSALNTRALERQIQILQEMGCNAIRTSHNPPAPELLDLCDRMGMVVMDESFDCWERQKKPNDYHLIFDDWHEKDWRAQLRRDRNHPCVIIWSIGNEIPEQGTVAKHSLAAELTKIAHEEDPTRPTSAACNNVQAGFNGFAKYVDVFGYNYRGAEYGRVHAANPGLPIYGSETSSCVSSRGEYFFPVSNDKNEGRADFQVSSYDLYAPRWAMPPDLEFRYQDQNPFVAGEFVWTGFDYLGEPTPYNNDTSNLLNFSDPAEKARMEQELKELGKIKVPSRSSYFGIIDLAGFKKDRFYIYQARWRPDLRMAHVLPHWNWPERVGQVTPVHVYTSGDEAELFLNGKSLGRRKKGQYEYRLRWDDVVYQPGELKVVAYKNGRKWATDMVKTTGAAAGLSATPDRDKIRADGKDFSFVTIAITDKDGLVVPRAKNRIQFAVSGPGEIVATDNGDATSLESFQSRERNAYNGLCLVIIRSKAGQTGEIKLTATSPGLKTVSTSIKSAVRQ